MMISIEKLRSRAILLSMAIIAIGGLVWFLVVSDTEGDLFGQKLREGTLPIINFETLTSDNEGYLLCTSAYCKNTKADREASTYPYPIATVSQALFAYTDHNQSVTTHRSNLQLWQFDLSEYAPGESFPDLITVRFISNDQGKTTVIIYSRSVIGNSAKSHHKERVERWLRFLQANL